MKQFVVSDEAFRRAACNRLLTPFRKCVGQDAAVEKLLDLAYQGFSDPYHAVPENVMLAGPPSTGKTTLVKWLVKMLDTPAVFTDSTQLNSGVNFADKKIPGGPDTAIHLILDAWARTQYPLQAKQAGSFAVYQLPPMTVFIDEIHGIKRKTADSLLKATERADGMLFGSKAVMNCKKVLFVGATTDWGKLPPAFRSRFNRVDLQPPTQDEVAQIVFNHNSDWDVNVCKKVVFFAGCVPREALAFARNVRRHRERTGENIETAVKTCAQREGIDQWGLHRQRLDLLKTLNKGDKILRDLGIALHCEGEEVVKHWLPPLLNQGWVYNDQGTYSLTETGKHELRKRDIL